ncbi:zinc ribbon domain-containing protein [Floridanema evergladense]|uniref:Zinc ribbon domain-containing protein n=1 Tax=Floridaenema evergladense BLCC-F167 TaxID=3153639 RepID=A0ABV4WJK1_9CYAN
MNTYLGNLGSGQQVYVENQGTQTIVTLFSSSPGQQQSQSNSFTTGSWVKPPALFRTASGAILQIETQSGNHFVSLQTNGMSTLNETPSLSNAENIPLQQTEKNPISAMPPMPPIQAMEPMKPMEPMRMGNMEMQMSPTMQMRMGSMELKMPSIATGTPAKGGFCTQCGNPITEQDKFCGRCGHQLR